MKGPSSGAIAVILGLLLMILACADADRDEGPVAARGDESTPATGDILVEGSIGDASNLIPLLATDSASHSISGLIFNGLVKYDRDLNIVGDLAESWDISKDGLVITFHLRKGVRWHDGRPSPPRTSCSPTGSRSTRRHLRPMPGTS